MLQVIIVALVIIFMIHVILKNFLNEDFIRRVPIVMATDKLKSDLTNYLFNDSVSDTRESPKESNFFDADLAFNNTSTRYDEKTDLSQYFNNLNPFTSDEQKRRFGDPLPQKKPMQGLEYDFMGNPLHYDLGSNGELTLKKDLWKYPNEHVMNGGVLDGVKGFDEEWDNYVVV